MIKLLSLSTCLLAAACGSNDPAKSDDSDTPEGSGTGSLSLRFQMDVVVWENTAEPAVGRFYGSYWNADDVTVVGPNEGAEDLQGIEADVDLSASAGPTEVLLQIDGLPVGWVTALGFLDSDTNSEEADRSPDGKDPVTLPHQNEVEVLEDQVVEHIIFFGLLAPEGGA